MLYKCSYLLYKFIESENDISKIDDKNDAFSELKKENVKDNITNDKLNVIDDNHNEVKENKVKKNCNC